MGEESGISDEVLWRQVVNGDGDAFGVLFDRHHDRVWRHALKVLGLHDMAEDVTAVVFYEAWRRRANVRMVNDSMLPAMAITGSAAPWCLGCSTSLSPHRGQYVLVAVRSST